MKLLKNTKFAGGVAVVMCVLSMFIGTNKSLAALSNETEDMFSSGMMSSEGYRQPSIESQLLVCTDAAMGLVTFARNYSELSGKADALASARNELLNASGISEISRKNSALMGAFNDLYTAMYGTGLTERDQEAADAYAKDFNSAQLFIASLAAGYNAEVAEYEKAAGNFPANLFGWFADAPDTF